MTTTRPARLSSSLAVAAAWIGLFLLADPPAQRAALLVQLVGLTTILVGVGGWLAITGPDHRIVGSAVGVLGILLVLAGGGVALTGPLTIGALGEFVVGYLGVTFVALGVSRVRPGTERAMLTAGASLLLIAVAIGAMVYGSSLQAQLAGGVAAIVAWDLGEQAVNLGEQVGRRARTRGVELVHAGGTLGVGVLALALIYGVRGAELTGVPLGGLLVLLVAGLTLSVSLYN